MSKNKPPTSAYVRNYKARREESKRRRGPFRAHPSGATRARPRGRRPGAPLQCSIVTPVFAHGGTERWIKDLISSTPPQVKWNEICVVNPTATVGDTSEVRARGVAITRGLRRAAQLARTQDVIVTWGMASHGYWSLQSPARLVAVAHGDGSSSFTRAVMASNRSADLMVACSPAAVDTFPQGVRGKVICNAVNLERLKPSPAARRLRESLLGGARHLLGFVGRFSWEKNPYEAIHVLRALPQEWRLVMVGDGEERGAVESLVRQHGLGPRAKLLGVRADVADLYEAFDAVLVPSTQEGFGYVIAEGWATGTPVFSTSVGAAKLWPHAVFPITHAPVPSLQTNDTARTVAERGMAQAPSEATARAILRAFSPAGSAERRRRVQAGREVVSRHLSLSGFGQSWARALASVAGVDCSRKKK